MKTVILDFETDEQAEKFFSAFAGIGGIDEDIQKHDAVENAIDNLFAFCDVGHVSTKEENAAYTILAS